MSQITFTIGNHRIRVRLRPTPTAQRIAQTLPLHSIVRRWGGLLTVSCRAESGLEADACDVLQRGEIGFHLADDDILFGLGPTPLSRAGEVRLERPVNIWADAVDDLSALTHVQAGTAVMAKRG